MKNSSFTVKNGDIEKLKGKLVGLVGVINKDLQKKMELATTIIYKTATARRPKLSAAKGSKKGQYRASDPSAIIGVPVKTGKLQISIQKSVSRQGDTWIGRIWTDSPYAKFVEFGTSKMKPRSFMRAALNQQGDTVKRIFAKQIDTLAK